MSLKNYKKEIVRKLEKKLDGSECPNCKNMSLKVIIGFVGDDLDGEAECTNCGKKIHHVTGSNVSEVIKIIRKMFSDIKKN